MQQRRRLEGFARVGLVAGLFFAGCGEVMPDDSGEAGPDGAPAADGAAPADAAGGGADAPAAPDAGMLADAGGSPDAAGPPPGSVRWVGHLGGAGDVRVTAVDGAGALVAAAGFFSGSIDVGGAARAASGSHDIFVALFDVDRDELLWVRTFGGSGSDIALGVAVDADGDVLFGGRTGDGAQVAFDNHVVSGRGNNDGVLAKLRSSDGVALWAVGLGGTGHDGLFELATDASGNVFVTGYFNNTAYFDSLNARVVSTQAVFAASYEGSGGSLRWVRAFDGAGSDSGLGIDVDAAGEVYVAGVYEDKVTFGGTVLDAAGGRDVFVAKLANGTGDVRWAQSHGGAGTDRAWRVSATPGATVAVVGYFSGTATIGGGQYTASDGSDIFVLSLKASGATETVLQLDASADFYGIGAAVTPGGLLVAGSYQGGVDLGTGALSAAGGTDIFLGRYDAIGAASYVSHWGGPNGDGAHAVRARADGSVIVGAHFAGTADFETAVLSSSGGSLDSAILVVNP